MALFLLVILPWINTLTEKLPNHIIYSVISLRIGNTPNPQTVCLLAHLTSICPLLQVPGNAGLRDQSLALHWVRTGYILEILDILD